MINIKNVISACKLSTRQLIQAVTRATSNKDHEEPGSLKKKKGPDSTYRDLGYSKNWIITSTSVQYPLVYTIEPPC